MPRSWGDCQACNDASMRNVRRLVLLIVGSALAMCGSALGSTSGAQLWSALGGDVTCGVAIHPPNTPPIQLLCSARSVPAPAKGHGIGDPGFVFLGSVGRPMRARLSQDSFVGVHSVKLHSPSSWMGGPIDVKCTISAKAVRCVNRTHHGFTITKSSYRAF